GDVERLHEPGVDRAGDHQAHVDAVSAQVEAQDLGDATQPELAGTVGRVPREPGDAGRGRDVDDRAAATSFHHARHERLDHVDGTHQVDVDDGLPLLVLEPVDPSPRRDAGDVHHDVNGFDLLVNLVGQGLDC